MKVPLPSNPMLYPHRIHAISCSLRSLLFSSSTDTLTRAFPSPFASLRSRIWRAKDPTLSVAPILHNWVDQGKRVSNQDLQKLIRILRKNSRFIHALQISQWMSDRPGYKLSQGDVGIRLDLISRAYGLEQAEVYFDSIPETWRGCEVYGALLNCYAHHKCLDKAEATMQQMREKGFLKNTLSYNVMLNLYVQMEKHEKVDILVQEMEKKGIGFNRVTYRICLNACVANSNIEEMEKLLMMMEAVPRNVDWHAYVIATNVYLKAGLTEKILTMLKRSEQFITLDSRRFAYESLLTSYAAIGNKDELCQIWNLYKHLGRFSNSVYLCMISSLVKLDDIDGAERLLEESESNKPLFDVRILDVMITTYSKKGLWEKAEAFVNKAVQVGKELQSNALDHLATAYCVDGQMAKAVKTLKKAILARKPGWKPNINTLAACLDYLELQGDMEGVDELLRIFSEDRRLLNVMITAYSKEGRWKNAEVFVNMAVQSGKELQASTWDHLATAYRVDGQMEKAVEALKKAISASEPGWKPNTCTSAACLEYMKLQGDMEELLKTFRADHRFLKALEDYAKQPKPRHRSYKAFVQMEGDDQTL